MSRSVIIRRGFFAMLACLLTVAQAEAATVEELVSQLKSPDAQARAHAAMDLADMGPRAAAAVDPLRAALKDSEPLVRAHAARALGDIGIAAMPAAEDLAKAIADPDMTVQRAAIGALQDLKPGPERVVPLMLKALEDEDTAVVTTALHSLADIGEPVVPPMIEALKDPRTAYWACLVLADIGPAARDATPGLISVLESDKPEVRMEAAMALGAIGPDAAPAVEALVAHLEDQELAPRYAAVYALGNIGPAAVASTPELEALLESDDVFMKTVSTWALAKTHPEDAEYRTRLTTKMFPVLTQAIKDKERRTRLAAARTINELKPPPEMVVPAFARLIATSDPETVRDVLDAVSSLGARAVPGLTRALKFPEVRGQVAMILGNIGPEAAPAVPALIEALEEEQRPEVRRELLFALGHIGPAAKAAVPLARQALRDEDPQVRYGAVWLIGRVGPDAKDALVDLKDHIADPNDPYFCNVCAWAAIRIDPQNPDHLQVALPVLIKALESEEAFVRVEAASTLGMLGERAKTALPALEKLREDPDQEVSQAATEAIRQISGS